MSNVTPPEDPASDEPWRATIPAFQEDSLFQEYLEVLKADRSAFDRKTFLDTQGENSMIPPRTTLLMLLAMAAVCSATRSTMAEDPKPFEDERFKFTLAVPEPWATAPLSQYTVPGTVRAAWSGAANASIVAFVQEPGQAFSPRFLVDESSKAMKEKLGCKVSASEVKSIDGKTAMWMVVTGHGTGGALTGRGNVETTAHWVAIPREKDIVVVLLTCPASEYEKLKEGFEEAVKKMKVQGIQTLEQSKAK